MLAISESQKCLWATSTPLRPWSPLPFYARSPDLAKSRGTRAEACSGACIRNVPSDCVCLWWLGKRQRRLEHFHESDNCERRNSSCLKESCRTQSSYMHCLKELRCRRRYRVISGVLFD